MKTSGAKIIDSLKKKLTLGFNFRKRIPYLMIFFKSFFLAATIFILGFNYMTLIYPATEAKELVSSAPFDVSFHQQLLKDLITLNDFRSAKKEVLIIKNLANNSSWILDYEAEIQRLERKPEEAAYEIVQLRNTVSEKPGYRDAYLRLAILSWQIYNDDEAKLFLAKALYLDPNYEDSKKFEKMVYGK